jgi:hypothetical protein
MHIPVSSDMASKEEFNSKGQTEIIHTQSGNVNIKDLKHFKIPINVISKDKYKEEQELKK